MIIVKTASAGTMESSDAYVTAEPCSELKLEIESVVMGQYGDAIRKVAEDTLKDLGLKSGLITIKDRGAVDCVIAARVETCVKRAGGEKA